MFRILVVDDEPDLRYVLRRVLERAGHEVTDVADGAAGLAAVHRSPPDLVVTDIMMPVMDGAELIRRLRADPSTTDIPILAVTSDAGLAVGADAVLAKPWRRDQLLTTANQLLTKKAEK